MSDVPFQEQVADSVPKINNEVAVGEDLNFQRRWWKFEGVMWWLIAGMLLLNFAGAFGRGPLAHVRISSDAMVAPAPPQFLWSSCSRKFSGIEL